MRNPMDDPEELDDIPPEVVRYVAGECSAAEAADLERRMVIDARLAEQVEMARQVWAAAAEPRKQRDVSRAWEAVRAQLDDRAADRPVDRPAAKRFGAAFGQYRGGGRIAAAAAVLLAIALPAAAIWRLGQLPNAPTAPRIPPAREYATLTGERAELRLPDGTRVVLGAASRLTVPGNFNGGGARDVRLDGQAHFDVVHDEKRPFRVRTALGVAEDIGTAFVVTTYPEAGGMRVAVASGIVALATGAKPGKLVLRQGDLGRLDSAGVGQVQHGVDVDAELAWTRGELVFRRTPLRQVLPQLERWYGIRVRLASRALGEVPVSASFADQPPAEALAFIAAAVGGRLVRESSSGDSAFTLYSR